MRTTNKYQNRISNQNRIMRRRNNRITAVTVITTACILATSVTVIAAPMKQNSETYSGKVSLPKAGICKVVSDYAQTADEADISVLAADIFKSASASDFNMKQTAQVSEEQKEDLSAFSEDATAAQKAATQLASIPDIPVYEEPVYTEPAFEEPVYEEPVYEEPVYEEPVYEEPVYEEPVAEEPVSEEPVSEEPVAEEPVYEEPVYEEPVAEEPVYEEPESEEPVSEEPEYAEPETEYVEPETQEPEYEEETLEEYLEEQAEELERQAQEKEEQAQTGDESGAYLGQTIANDACQYVGVTPYVWAGCSLETGTDCSGFTMLIYAKYGYELSHDSNVQSCQGRSVALSEALPGDIVVYAGHVAMYIGNGQVVHCPQPGEYVSIASVNMMPVYDVRRIIG